MKNYWPRFNFLKDKIFSPLRFFLQKQKNKTLIKKQHYLDKKLVFTLSKSKIPTLKQLKYTKKFLSVRETRLIQGLTFIILISLLFLGTKFYLNHIEEKPAEGGQYSEALIGQPRYINPLLSQTNDVDMDLVRLIYSGLLKYNKHQELTPDLATRFEISSDEKTYTFYLREDVKWHDGEPLTADDVIFTFKTIQDPDFKSPLLISFRGVTVEKIDDYSLKFILEKSFIPFLSTLTVGILPEHLWYNIPPLSANLAEYNLKPIGNGPFHFTSLVKDKIGNIKSYTLKKNENFYGPSPFLEKIIFKFYPNFEEAVLALKNKNVQGISFLPNQSKESLGKAQELHYYTLNLSQYTAVFFNQKNNEILKERKVREALAYGTDKEKIAQEALRKEAEIIHGPILPGFVGYNPDIQKFDLDLDLANQILNEAGWKSLDAKEYFNQRKTEELKKLEEKAQEEAEAESEETEEKEQASEKNEEEVSEDQKAEPFLSEEKIPEQIVEELLAQELDPNQTFYRKKGDKILEITLTTVNQPENVQVADLIKNSWQNLGIKVNLNIVEAPKIKKEIIKPRVYEALLYGEMIGRDPDPYPFWHSSQNEDPGLNLAVFANKEVDQVLEEARTTSDPETRRLKYRHFQNILVAELPAIFLIRPTYTYAISQTIKGFDLDRLTNPSDRFTNIEEWYMKTKRVWK